MTFIAKYPGTCETCEGPIVPGEEVEYLIDGALTHIDCSQPVPPGPAAGQCPVCHLTLPLTGVCDEH